MASFFQFYFLSLLFFSYVGWVGLGLTTVQRSTILSKIEALWETKHAKNKTEASNMRHKKSPKSTVHSMQKVTATKSFGNMVKGREKEKKRKGPKRYTYELEKKKPKKGVVVIPCHDRYIDQCRWDKMTLHQPTFAKLGGSSYQTICSGFKTRSL